MIDSEQYGEEQRDQLERGSSFLSIPLMHLLLQLLFYFFHLPFFIYIMPLLLQTQFKSMTPNQIYSKNNLYFFLLFILFISISQQVYAQQYQIPPTTDLNDKPIRINQIKFLNEPSISLNKIYRRQVYQISKTTPKDSNESINIIQPSQICSQSSPQVSFEGIGYYFLSQVINPYVLNQSDINKTNHKSERIIYDYQVLKSKFQNILDMIYYEDYIFTISSNALINVYKIIPFVQNGIQLKASVAGIDWQNLNKKRLQEWKKRQDEQKAREQNESNKTILGNQGKDEGVIVLKNDTEKIDQKKTDDQQKKVNVRLLQQGKNQSLGNQSEPKYYTGPPPQILTGHLNKGYFEFLENYGFLVFSNDQFLIGLDVRTFKVQLLSEQIQYQVLQFETAQNSSNETNSSNNKANNSTNNNDSKKTTNSTDSTSITNDTSSNNDTSSSNSTSNANQTVNSTLNSTNNSNTSQILNLKPPIIPEYAYLENFQEITKIDESHFAVVDRKKGVYIYQIIKNQPDNSSHQQHHLIRLIQILDQSKFQKTYKEGQGMNLVDVQYSQKQKLLFVLDYEKGVFSFDFDYIKTVGNSKIVITLNYEAILKKMCSLMEFSQNSQTLYLACNKIYRINLERWPVIKQKTFPHPMINIRQIFIQQSQDIFVLAGYSVFKVMYLQRAANYFEDDMLDKIVFTDKFAITANQNHIIVLKYNVEKPTIFCQTSNISMLGNHQLMLRTTAQCKQQYLKTVNFTFSQKKKIDSEDMCIYTVYQNLYVWEQGQIPIKPLAIVLLIFLIFLVVMIIWFVLVKFRMQRAQQHLQYLSQQGHKQLVQEEIKSQKYNSENIENQNSADIQNQQNEKSGKEGHKTDQDPNKDLYSIQ